MYIVQCKNASTNARFRVSFLIRTDGRQGCRNNRNAIGSLAESKLRVEPWYRANRGRHSLSCRGTQPETTDEDRTGSRDERDARDRSGGSAAARHAAASASASALRR